MISFTWSVCSASAMLFPAPFELMNSAFTFILLWWLRRCGDEKGAGIVIVGFGIWCTVDPVGCVRILESWVLLLGDSDGKLGKNNVMERC